MHESDAETGVRNPDPLQEHLDAFYAAAEEPDPEEAKRLQHLAFEPLVRETYAQTFTLAMRMVDDVEDARDVTQEAYLRAYRALPNFQGNAHFTTWLYRITANRASTALETRHRRRREVLKDEYDENVVDVKSPDPVAVSENREVRAGLVEALAELPPRLRSVVVLRDIYDMTHEAIAEELGISVNAAKVRLHRARKKLRERLNPPAAAEVVPTEVTPIGTVAVSGELALEETA